VPVHADQPGDFDGGWAGTVPAGSTSTASPRSLRSTSQTPQRRWSDGAASQRSPLSDASITAAAAELAVARAAGLQARTQWQTPLLARVHAEQPRTLLPDAQARSAGTALQSPEERRVFSPALQAVSPVSQSQGTLHAGTAADLFAGHSEPHSPADDQQQADLPVQGCLEAARVEACSWSEDIMSGSALTQEQEPQALRISAQQYAAGQPAEDHPASCMGNGWHPRSSFSRLPSDFGGDPAEDVPLRVRFGGSRSRTPTPHPSDDGGPLVGAHSTTAGGIQLDGWSARHVALPAPSAAEREHVSVADSRPHHQERTTAAADDVRLTHADSGRMPTAVAAATAAEILANASAASVPPEQWAIDPDAARTLPHQLDVQQPGRPIMRWAQRAAPTASAEQAPAQGQEPQCATSSLPQMMRDLDSGHGQHDNDVDPLAGTDLADSPLDGVQLPAVTATSHSQPAHLRALESMSRDPLPMQDREGIMMERRSPGNAVRQADQSASAHITPRDGAATPRRGLLARLPFAGVLRARRWRRRSDGHTVDETILGARPPSHDGGVVSAGFCTPPRTPRRYMLT